MKVIKTVTGYLQDDFIFVTADAWNKSVWDALPVEISVNGMLYQKASYSERTRLGQYIPTSKPFVIGFAVGPEDDGKQVG